MKTIRSTRYTWWEYLQTMGLMTLYAVGFTLALIPDAKANDYVGILPTLFLLGWLTFGAAITMEQFRIYPYHD